MSSTKIEHRFTPGDLIIYTIHAPGTNYGSGAVYTLYPPCLTPQHSCMVQPVSGPSPRQVPVYGDTYYDIPMQHPIHMKHTLQLTGGNC